MEVEMRLANSPAVISLIELALSEDLSMGDITSEMLIPADAAGQAKIVAKDSCIISGQELAQRVFQRVDPEVEFKQLIPDGTHVDAGTDIATVGGAFRSILSGERVALNFLQRLSGISTATSKAAAICDRYGCKIVDTRKTTPGFRVLDKYAVRTGGGSNHRFSLSDGILIKENHIQAAGGVEEAVTLALKHRRHPLKVQIETRTLEEAERAVSAGADALLLDNMNTDSLVDAVSRFSQKVLLETSGNITLDNLAAYAATGVHLISMGALTHSVMAADISLYII
jgi:nicotinate-nucleotide pyrophosphorylase (carboxylating)